MSELGPVTLDDQRRITYDDLLATFPAEVAVFVTTGDYQGDHLVLLRRGGEYGYLEVGYGSCSGCDALEAVAPAWYEDAQPGEMAEVTKLRDDLWQGVLWKPAAEMREYLAGKDWALTFYGDEDSDPRIGEFRTEALAAIDVTA